MEISTDFVNMEKATEEDCATATNLTIANLTLSKQVVLYAKRLSTKKADNMALQTATKNLQGEVKNIKA